MYILPKCQKRIRTHLWAARGQERLTERKKCIFKWHLKEEWHVWDLQMWRGRVLYCCAETRKAWAPNGRLSFIMHDPLILHNFVDAFFSVRHFDSVFQHWKFCRLAKDIFDPSNISVAWMWRMEFWNRVHVCVCAWLIFANLLATLIKLSQF